MSLAAPSRTWGSLFQAFQLSFFKRRGDEGQREASVGSWPSSTAADQESNRSNIYIRLYWWLGKLCKWRVEVIPLRKLSQVRKPAFFFWSIYIICWKHDLIWSTLSRASWQDTHACSPWDHDNHAPLDTTSLKFLPESLEIGPVVVHTISRMP